MITLAASREFGAQVDSGAIHWDIVDLDLYDAVRGCDEGLLEPLPRDPELAGRRA